ncbi:hypothetical protein [Mesorhizobium sp. IMUNJ 23232]|uniref:hypothetical protein n=1 Tax=Mesorhizobium sp. IMUNJ 23232 TaxID=3376064 RepID=UPI0037AAA695
MTRKLDISARQVTAICKGAAKAGFVAEIKIGEVVVRLVPDDGPLSREHVPEFDDGLYQESLHELKKAQGMDEPLSRYEEQVLSFIAANEGKRFSINEVRGAGPTTTERLRKRGFVEFSYRTHEPMRIDEIWATEAAVRFLRMQQRHYKRFIVL